MALPVHLILPWILLFDIWFLATAGSVAVQATDHGVLKVDTPEVNVILGQNATVPAELHTNDTTLAATVSFEFQTWNIVANISDLDLVGPVASFFIPLVPVNPGETVLLLHSSDTDLDVRNAFIRITVSKAEWLNVVSDVVGWLYFVAWSASFYPQIFQNWKRQSVVGLNFDFLALNIMGFVFYGVFNVALYYITPIQNEYFARHPTGINPVQLNDVIFSLHAVVCCLITMGQCLIYERGHQTVSKTCGLIMAAIGLAIVVSLCLSLSHVMLWLDFLYVCSYAKLGITLIKYVPQAFMNYRRKSTHGWSIGNILLDFTGGTLSICQMLILAYNNDDWGSIFGDPTKFGLGFFSILFDVFFMLQHYVFYRNAVPHEPLASEDEEPAANGNDDQTFEDDDREQGRPPPYQNFSN
ncbi:cystinosin homolog [Tigriopus californicus]|uniref:cystinosin homolog n=1 Tax=Tigriopus californicus TaxID=6832 RepID=UPI0027DA97DE|nr:cystinosin homolog [Tigriopus californicus]|eukprot:TCALIF_00511-PA protein Name:"Similar to CG17119 Cystinosin homolog (Drosophila melanogaster)" AED:0.04 eAED:0.04 QI:209/1/1/1/0.85/0.87/8/1770/411